MTGGLFVKPLSTRWSIVIFSRLSTIHVKIENDGLFHLQPPVDFVDVTWTTFWLQIPDHATHFLQMPSSRIGLAERTGRGIDRIYEGMLRYGRPALPDYSLSNEYAVHSCSSRMLP
jgi:ATP-dependent DNA helicase RecG